MPSISSERPADAASMLADHHSELDTLIGELLAALEAGDKAKAFERLDLLWARLAVHIRAEHLCLFPSILDAPRENFTVTGGAPEYQEAQSAINQLRLDHEFFMRELGMAVNTMRKQEITSDHEINSEELIEVRRSVVKVQGRLDQHNQLEENHVYKWVSLLLGKAERVALATRIRHELENTPLRFRSDFR
jgi:hypothetical protein